jgi:RHS repeat-associated protein
LDRSDCDPKHLNTPRQVYDDQQQLRWKWDQAEPFGVTTPDENPVNLGAFELPLRLSGQYADKETGLHQNGYRDYWPDGGRYPQSDLIGLRGGPNTYLYVGAKPLWKTDFLGLLTDDQCCDKAKGMGLTADDAGGVICCEGRKVPCAWESPGIVPSAGRIRIQCIKEHEIVHFEHVPQCKPCEGITRPEFKPDIDPSDGECQANSSHVSCLKNRRQECAGNPACVAVVDAEIKARSNIRDGYCNRSR